MERETITIEERKVSFECDGRIESQYPNRGWWAFFAVDGKGNFLVAREGYFEINDKTTIDTADFIAAKESIVWAALDYPHREIEILTKSSVIVNWLQDESSTQHLEIYRELYERKALTDKYTIRQIPEENNRAVNPARRRDLVIAKYNKSEELAEIEELFGIDNPAQI
ncbi:MAG: hypothetical protein M3388_07005 [Acidobacteriota bacterium]|nr:hypothetical protein [Acidobacteriota bacterium]